MLKVLDLFSGIGGFSLGLQATNGFETVAFCEIDTFCQKVLKKHWPDVPCFTDITKLDKEALDKFGQIDVICGGFPCFVAGTLIETSDGLRPIEELQIGDEVRTHNNRFQKIYSTMKRDAPIFEVDIKGSIPTQVTGEHPYLVRRLTDSRSSRGGKVVHAFSNPEWVKAKDLDESCYVGMPLDIPDQTLRTWESEAFWYLIGRWLGDGWIVDHKRTSKIPQGHRGSRINSQVWKAIICTSHEDAPILKEHIQEAGYHATEAKERTTTKFHISSMSLVKFLEPFGRGADKKKVPGYVFRAPIDLQKAIFRGWIDSDGYENDKMICGTTVSKELAGGMARIARNAYRMPVTIRLAKIPDKTTIEGRIVSQKPFYQVRLWKTSRSICLWEENVCWQKVRYVHELNTIKTVYNISVVEDETYIANESIVHNCQDISCAGKGAGIHAERSGLWWEMLRIVRLVRPRFVLVENVAALLNRGLDEVLGSLAESGYDAEWTILRACDFGLPHRRERIYLIAYSGRLRPNAGWTKQPLSGTGADGKEGITTNPAGIRRGGILRQRRKAESFRVKGDGDTWNASNAMRPGLSQPKQERELRRSITQCNWGQAPSPICRVDDVIPYRMDRLRALGNAIVPQCAQFVGQCLLDSIEMGAAQ